MYQLGDIYLKGELVNHNITKAIKDYELAVYNLNFDTVKQLEILNNEGRIVDKSWFNQQILYN